MCVLPYRSQVEGEGFKFAPSMSSMVKHVLDIIDYFVAMMNTIPRIESELGKAAGGARLLSVATVDDELVVEAKTTLTEIVEMSMEMTKQMVKACLQ